MFLLRQLLVLLCLAAVTAAAQEKLARLTIRDQTYTNVTVTAVTATDIFFAHGGGMGNAKLRELDPAMQAHFHYDAAKSALLERERASNNILYRQYILTNPPPPAPAAGPEAGGDDGDFVAPNLHARSVLGRQPPRFVVEQWLTPRPDVTGKFIMIVFWATSSDACHRTIPQLNALSREFRDRLVIVGISNEPEEVVRRMSDPPVDFALAVDSRATMARALEITAIPHCILIDPHTIVRYEGVPGFLDEDRLEHLLSRYR